MIEDKVDITPLSRVLLETLCAAGKKTGSTIYENDSDIVEIALMTSLCCQNEIFNPGGIAAFCQAVGIVTAGDKIQLEEKLIKILQDGTYD